MINEIIKFTLLAFLITFQISLNSVELNSVPVSTQSDDIIPEFNLASTGDWGCNSETKNTVSNIIGTNPELVLGLGELFVSK